MALTTATKLKASWLNITTTDHDTKLGVLIAQAEAIIKGICKQPIASETVAHDFSGNNLQTYLLPYTVPVVLTSLQYKENPDDAAWTTATGAIVVKADGVWQVYYENGLTYSLWRANMTVGYDGTTYTIPKDIENIAEEMTVELFKATDYAGRENRFGVGTLSTTEGGVTQTTQYKSLDQRFRLRLRPYILRAWI